MKTLLVAAMAATLIPVARAEVLANGQKSAPMSEHGVMFTAHPETPHLQKAIEPSVQPSKWTWIPAKADRERVPQTQIVAIAVPAPGAAALIGAAGLITARRRR